MLKETTSLSVWYWKSVWCFCYLWGFELKWNFGVKALQGFLSTNWVSVFGVFITFVTVDGGVSIRACTQQRLIDLNSFNACNTEPHHTDCIQVDRNNHALVEDIELKKTCACSGWRTTSVGWRLVGEAERFIRTWKILEDPNTAKKDKDQYTLTWFIKSIR